MYIIIVVLHTVLVYYSTLCRVFILCVSVMYFNAPYGCSTVLAFVLMHPDFKATNLLGDFVHPSQGKKDHCTHSL